MEEKIINGDYSERDEAIRITGLKKRYRLGLISAGTLKGDLQSWWARKRGKEDPNLKIGAKVHSKNEVFMALDGIDLTVYKGERIGIIGHNGAGKSTLLKLLARVTGPTEGEIKIDGRITSMLEVGTGFNGELTGRENIYLNGAILGMTKAEVDKKMEDIIEFSECRQFIDTPVKRYSSGMFVKLAFSVAAHLDSEIMIMDEVLAVGDMAFQKKCLDKMSEVSIDEGKTILYVSHNMNTIRQLCSRCIVLKRGKIIFNGDVEEAISVYMEGRSGLSDYIDFSDVKRLRYLGNDIKCKIEYVKNLSADKEYVKDKITFEMKIKCFSAVKNLKIRFEISRIGRGVAVSMSDKKYDLQEGEEKTLQLQIDVSHLVEETYDTTIVLFEESYNRSVDIDCVRSLSFVKQSKDIIKWNENVWGNVIFDNIVELSNN